MFHSVDYQPQRKDGKFREYKPYTRGNAVRITDEQWEPFLPLIRCLHNARRTRAQILEVLREHGLEPSVAQLFAKMSRWGLKGYGSGDGAEKESPIQTRPAKQTPPQLSDSSADSSEDSLASSDSANCFSNHDVDTSDTMYESEAPPATQYCEDVATAAIPAAEVSDEIMTLQHHESLAHLNVDAPSISTDSIDGSSMQDENMQRLPTDLMAFIRSTADINEFDQYDILNEVASFLCATSSFSDAFVLFDASYGFLKDKRGPPLALVFATINCLRSATFREQCQYAGALMGEAIGSLRLMSYSNPWAGIAFASLEVIGRELCVNSELDYLNILYTQMTLRETPLSTMESVKSSTNEVLLHCSDPFLLARADDRPDLLTQSMEVNGITLGRIVGKLSRWCCAAIEDFNPVSMLPSAGFNPSDTISVARFATALSCHFVRKWSFLSLAEVLGHCNELLPPNRKDAAARLCKLAIRVLSTLAVYTIHQATGMTLRCISEDDFMLPEVQARYKSPLANHLDVLSRMGSKQRVMVFAEMHKTLYNRTLVYRQQMDDHCLTAHVRETGFLLAASLIRLKRELNSEVPQPAHDIERIPSPVRSNHSPSRCSSNSSRNSTSSMQKLARRNLLIPGMMSKNGSHLRSSWARRLSTDSNESWNFTKVTGLPSGPTPPESIKQDWYNDNEENNDADDDIDDDDNGDHEMTGMDMF